MIFWFLPVLDFTLFKGKALRISIYLLTLRYKYFKSHINSKMWCKWFLLRFWCLVFTTERSTMFPSYVKAYITNAYCKIYINFLLLQNDKVGLDANPRFLNVQAPKLWLTRYFHWFYMFPCMKKHNIHCIYCKHKYFWVSSWK